MTTDELARRVDEVRAILDTQEEQLVLLQVQAIANTARSDAILLVLQEILERQGVPKAEAEQMKLKHLAKCLTEASAVQLAVAAKSKQGRPPTASGLDAEKN